MHEEMGSPPTAATLDPWHTRLPPCLDRYFPAPSPGTLRKVLQGPHRHFSRLPERIRTAHPPVVHRRIGPHAHRGSSILLQRGCSAWPNRTVAHLAEAEARLLCVAWRVARSRRGTASMDSRAVARARRVCCLSFGEALHWRHDSHARSTTTRLLDRVAIASIGRQVQTIEHGGSTHLSTASLTTTDVSSDTGRGMQVEATECHRAIARWWPWVRVNSACQCIVVAVLNLLEGPTPSGQLGKHLVEGGHTGLVRIRVLIVPSEPVFA